MAGRLPLSGLPSCRQLWEWRSGGVRRRTGPSPGGTSPSSPIPAGHGVLAVPPSLGAASQVGGSSPAPLPITGKSVGTMEMQTEARRHHFVLIFAQTWEPLVTCSGSERVGTQPSGLCGGPLVSPAFREAWSSMSILHSAAAAQRSLSAGSLLILRKRQQEHSHFCAQRLLAADSL